MLNSNFYLQYKNDLINFSKNKFNMELNLNNPLKLTDKINWLKIYDNTVLKSYCADKILLHNYSKLKLNEDICIPILNIYNSVNDLKINELPNKFVLKCNHRITYESYLHK